MYQTLAHKHKCSIFMEMKVNIYKFQPNFFPYSLYTQRLLDNKFPHAKNVRLLYITLHYSSGNSFILGCNYFLCNLSSEHHTLSRKKLSGKQHSVT